MIVGENFQVDLLDPFPAPSSEEQLVIAVSLEVKHDACCMPGVECLAGGPTGNVAELGAVIYLDGDLLFSIGPAG